MKPQFTVTSDHDGSRPGDPSWLPLRALFSLPVIVSALGFFVDVYDMLIFSIVRIPSLQSLGLSKADISNVGAFILNCQQAGLVVGGVLWGIVGDRRGRMSVLFSSIIVYSLANLACGIVPYIMFMTPTDYYALMRFIAGVGLSGEIGAAIVLVAEILPKGIRGFGTSVVAGIGYLGAGAAYATSTLFDWQTAFFVGGGMGLLLLLLRVSVFESGLFTSLKQQHREVSRGNFLYFFSSGSQAIKYLRCVALGLPTWFIVGILATFANEFGEAMAIGTPIEPGRCVMLLYVGLAFGDLLSGPLSQWLQSRKRAVFWLLITSVLLCGTYLFAGLKTPATLYAVTLLLGFCTGYIAMYLTMVAEQYGTNLRATATTSVPSIVRGMVIPMTLTFKALMPEVGTLWAAGLLGLLIFGLAFWSLSRMEETFAKELEYVEE
jgi:predicted MFS family arabinose efflux permease